jgi:RNA polymerase sigma-70 factor (ECF subfamily)
VGEWLPEPLVDDGRSDPTDHAEMSDSLSLAFLVLLESLTPEQRAAFLLREVFDYPYDQIAAIIGTGEDNTRQLVSRARKHVNDGRPRFEASQQRRDQLAGSFLAAVSNGDLQTLEELLAHDVELHGDGGGRVRAITRPIHGRAKVARALLSWMRPAEPFGGWLLHQVQVNGQPGAKVSDAAGKLFAVLVLDIAADGHIQAVRSIVNPDKLRHLHQTTP